MAHNDEDLSEDEVFQAPGTNTARVSAHVRDAHRLCCALTRAKDCLVVFMQLSLLLATAAAKQAKLKAAISDFARDACVRGLVSSDERLDDSPEGIELRSKWGLSKTRYELKRSKKEQDAIVTSGLRTAKGYTPLDARKEGRRQFQTPSGRRITEAISLQDVRNDLSAPVKFSIGTTQRGRKHESKAAKKAAPAPATGDQGKSHLVQLDAAETEKAKGLPKAPLAESGKMDTSDGANTQPEEPDKDTAMPDQAQGKTISEAANAHGEGPQQETGLDTLGGAGESARQSDSDSDDSEAKKKPMDEVFGSPGSGPLVIDPEEIDWEAPFIEDPDFQMDPEVEMMLEEEPKETADADANMGGTA